MKNNLNIIQIKGLRGILYIAFIGCCLVAGFGWFPGWICMKGWNHLAIYFEQIPAIGIMQGILLWGIIAASYFTFRKDKLVVCMRASDGLNEDELKAVFADMKKQANNDKFIKDLFKAQRAELRIKNLSESNITQVNLNELKSTSQNNIKNEQTEHVQMK